MQRLDQNGFCPTGRTKAGGQCDLSSESAQGLPVFSFVILAAFLSLEVTKGPRSNSILSFPLGTFYNEMISIIYSLGTQGYPVYMEKIRDALDPFSLLISPQVNWFSIFFQK